MMRYLLEMFGAGLGYTYDGYSSMIQGFGRQQWNYVLIGFAIFGCLCMRGMHRRI